MYIHCWPQTQEETTGVYQKSQRVHYSSEMFAKYYGGREDTRAFVWTTKLQQPVATSLDRLGEDYNRNLGITCRGIKQSTNMKAGLHSQKEEWLKHWLLNSKRFSRA